VAQFELCISEGVIPKSPRFYQRAEGSPVAHLVVAGDPFAIRLRACPELVEGMTLQTNEDPIRN